MIDNEQDIDDELDEFYLSMKEYSNQFKLMIELDTLQADYKGSEFIMPAIKLKKTTYTKIHTKSNNKSLF